MGFQAEANAAQVTWKRTSDLLPEGAQLDGPYRAGGADLPVCLPLEFAEQNLLPEAREKALERFRDDAIAWHAGTPAGPSTHLRSSQVQCVNALGPFIEDPAGLRQLLRTVLPVAEVLPFGAGAHPQDAVVFEWIGVSDHLGERGGATGVRGANTTSADAAVRYQHDDGMTEIVLIEWKYTERYGASNLPGGQASAAKRHETYRRWWGPDGPVRTDRVEYEQLFREPLYQLFRLQCLALEMERAGELEADRVRLLLAAPSRNTPFWTSVPDDLAGLGTDVGAVWSRLLRVPDRFLVFDTATLVGDRGPCPESFRTRYAHLRADTASLAEDPLEREMVADPAWAFRSAATDARATITRVFGDGSVLESIERQVSELGEDTDLFEAAVRLEEIAELARQVRAGPLARLHLRGRSSR